MAGRNPLAKPRMLGRSRAAAAMLDDLTAQIRSKELAPGSLILSGPALCKHYGISYQTVARALDELTADGWLVRQHGRGTFVAPHPPSGNPPASGTVLLALDPRSLERGRFGFAIVEALDEALARADLRMRYAPLSRSGEAALLEEVASGAGDVRHLIAFDRPAFLERALRRAPGLPALALHALPARAPRTARLDAVLVEDRAGGILAGEFLLARGHRLIAFLGGPKNDARAKDRGAGLREALRKNGVNLLAEVWAEGWNEEAGRAAGKKLLKLIAHSSGHPSMEQGAPAAGHSCAVFCANDRLASGLYEAAAQVGLRVPGHLSLIGFDDQEVAAQLAPPLTTVRIDRAEYGRQAAQLVKERLAEPGRPPRQIRMPVTLVERESVCTVQPAAER